MMPSIRTTPAPFSTTSPGSVSTLLPTALRGPRSNMSLRRRPAATPLADMPRRNSTLSDSVSEARSSIRSSTDDLFLPRVAQGAETGLRDDESESHWQSAPLGLALVPAVAGVFFHNGSAVLTDVTLLVLAAVFLNWSLRLPWYAPYPFS